MQAGSSASSGRQEKSNGTSVQKGAAADRVRPKGGELLFPVHTDPSPCLMGIFSAGLQEFSTTSCCSRSTRRLSTEASGSRRAAAASFSGGLSGLGLSRPEWESRRVRSRGASGGRKAVSPRPWQQPLFSGSRKEGGGYPRSVVPRWFQKAQSCLQV